MFKYTNEDLIIPTFQALKNIGRPASNDEITNEIVDIMNLNEEEVNAIHCNTITKLYYKTAWAKTVLRRAGYIANPSRGKWQLTQKGLSTEKINKTEIRNEYLSNTNASTSVKKAIKIVRNSNSKNIDLKHIQPANASSCNNVNNYFILPVGSHDNWKHELLKKVHQMSSRQFEHLSALVLKKLGYSDVIVTKCTHDQGIDGTAIRKDDILSSTVAFQSKRYAGTVSSSDVRKFIGAIAGKFSHGIMFTTGKFSYEAKKAANESKIVNIALVDSDKLLKLLKEYRLGVKVELVERVTISKDGFKNLIP